MLPAISLIGRNEPPLREAFEEFGNWSDNSNGDAVDVDFLFEKAGGYKLAVSPNPRALADRAFGYDAVFDPMWFTVTWIKSIDTTSQPLRDLRKYLEEGSLRPVLFSGAIYTGLDTSHVAVDFLKPIDGLRELLKFEMRFVDEGSATDVHWQRIVLGDRRARKAPKEMPPPNPQLLARTRTERLKTLFPVTLWRSRNLPAPLAVRKAAACVGLAEWQIDQALCNLFASTAMCSGRYYFPCISKSDWPVRYADWLRNSFEKANGDTTQFQDVRAEEIIKQATLDANVVLREYGRIPVNQTLNNLQDTLRELGLLSGDG